MSCFKPEKKEFPLFVTFPLMISSTMIDREQRLLSIFLAIDYELAKPIFTIEIPATQAPIANNRARIKVTVGQYNSQVV